MLSSSQHLSGIMAYMMNNMHVRCGGHTHDHIRGRPDAPGRRIHWCKYCQLQVCPALTLAAELWVLTVQGAGRAAAMHTWMCALQISNLLEDKEKSLYDPGL